MKKKIIISVAILVVLLVMAGGYYYAHYYSGYMRITANHTQLSSNGKSLFWFDVKHSNDINDVMFEDIEMEFKRFSPDLILVEGSADKDKSDTRDTAILNGESAFANYLGRQASVIVEDIEPPFSAQIEYLQSKYPVEKILSMYLIRQLCSEKMKPAGEKPDMEKLFVSQTKFLLENGLKPDTIDLSADHIIGIVNKYLPEPISAGNWEGISPRVYAKKGGALYDIYNDIYLFRNIYLVDLIRSRKEVYNRIFVVMGRQHLVDMKERLKDIYQ